MTKARSKGANPRKEGRITSYIVAMQGLIQSDTTNVI